MLLKLRRIDTDWLVLPDWELLPFLRFCLRQYSLRLDFLQLEDKLLQP